MRHYSSVQEMVGTLTIDGQSIALEGYNHLIPFAFAHEMIRAKRSGIHLLRLSADIVSDQLIGSGVVNRLTTGWQGNPIGGALARLNDARENKWPGDVHFDDLSHPSMVAAYTAGAARVPFAFVSDLPLAGTHAARLKTIRDPFSGNEYHVISPLNPDLAVLHAQRADHKGNVQIEGICGAAKEVVYASKIVAITVEEFVESLPPRHHSLIIPHQLVDAIAVAEKGAAPSYALDMYERDAGAYAAWPAISAGRESFLKWVAEL